MNGINNLITWVKATKLAQENIEIDTLISSCMKAGWDYRTSIYAIENALNIKIKKYIVPEPLSINKRTIDVGDKEVSILMHMKHPNIFLIDNLLSDIECDQIISLAKDNLEPSMVYNGTKSTFNKRRTSRTVSLDPQKHQDDEKNIINIIDNRLHKLILWPKDKADKIQVNKYAVNEEYKSHHDYFPTEKNGTNRVATIIVYLNEPEKGGETLFSDINLSIVPRKGMAVLFTYDRPYPTTLTAHSGCPVLKGEKWILTKFIRNICGSIELNN